MPPGQGKFLFFLLYMCHVYTNVGALVRVLIFNYCEFCDLV